MPLNDYLSDGDKTDLFEPKTSYLSFPCCACKHQDRDERECMGCAHYAM